MVFMCECACHCSHDELSGEFHCLPYCLPIQHLISLPVQMIGFYCERLVDGHKLASVAAMGKIWCYLREE